jgi:uncharacterized phage protein (TIGR01671 family)
MMMCVVSSLNIKTGKARVLFTRENGEKSYETIDISKSELMQYTGLKDRHGTEIYEGDILKFPNLTIGIVVWDDVAFAIKSPGSNAVDYEHSSVFNRAVVIGNIHQNPDLLKES